MTRPRPVTARVLAILLLVVGIVAAACGGSGSAVPTSSDSPASSTAPAATSTDDAAATPDGGEATPEPDASDDASGGTRLVTDAPGYDGQITFNAVLHSSNYDDTLKVTATLVLRQNSIHNLVYAKGSKVNVAWSVAPGDGYCPSSASWSGPLSSLNGEGFDALSDPKPVAWGQVMTGIDPGTTAQDAFLWLDIYVAAHETDGEKACTTPDFSANCPYEGAPTAPDAWVPKATDPRFQLTWACTDSRADSGYGYDVTGTGTLDEIAAAGG